MLGIRAIMYKLLMHRHRVGIKRVFKKFFKRIIDQNPDAKKTYNKTGLNQWLKKWSVFGMKPNKDLYSFYRCSVGDNDKIVPNDIARNYIEPILTPQEFQPFYNDKNSFGVGASNAISPYCKSFE